MFPINLISAAICNLEIGDLVHMKTEIDMFLLSIDIFSYNELLKKCYSDCGQQALKDEFVQFCLG